MLRSMPGVWLQRKQGKGSNPPLVCIYTGGQKVRQITPEEGRVILANRKEFRRLLKEQFRIMNPPETPIPSDVSPVRQDATGVEGEQHDPLAVTGSKKK